MKNITLYIFLVTVYILGLIYLVARQPITPSLDNSALSNEPGDTWQNPGQSGYYSNQSRFEILTTIQKKFHISIFGYQMPSYRLNYRPEEAHELVRDQLKSNYLEEIVYPLHSSVFVNGWEPKLAPRRVKKDLADDNLSINGIPYEAKITIKPTYSSPISRVAIWTAVFPLSYLVYLSIRKSINDQE